MVTGIDPRVDYVFKRLYGDEDNALLLVDLLNAVLRFPAGRLVSGVTLLNPFVASDYAEGKVSILDVRARDDPGRQFLLEMQQLVRPGFTKRLLYYWSGGHAGQILKGERHEMLLPTYSICFVNEALFPDAAWHHCFRVYDDAHGMLLCKDLEIHVLELSKFHLAVEQVRTPLERWCYFFKQGASLDLDALSATLDVPVIRKAVEVLVKISQNELERQRYLERQRAERDAASFAADLKFAQEERKTAEKKGQEIGRAIGRLIGRIQMLQQFLEQAETSTEELEQLPEENLVQLEDSLKQQLGAKKQANGTPPSGPQA